MVCDFDTEKHTMSTRIRLARAGRRNLPFYHLVVADSRAARDGKFIENVGYYDPVVADDKENRLKVNGERIKYWLEVGAIPSDRVLFLLKKANFGTEISRFKPRIRNTQKRVNSKKVSKK
jgi:small subunit ribosomal protein S16